jgi:hypothetical protein
MTLKECDIILTECSLGMNTTGTLSFQSNNYPPRVDVCKLLMVGKRYGSLYKAVDGIPVPQLPQAVLKERSIVTV